MSDRAGPPQGLCGRCRHAREVRNRRGSVFLMCGRSKNDPRYARYPVLPMLACPGFEAGREPRAHRQEEENEP